MLAAFVRGTTLEVQRSPDGGATFQSVLNSGIGQGRYPVVASTSSGVLVALPVAEAGARGPLHVWRSVNDGATWGYSGKMTDDGYRGPNVAVRGTAAGIWAIAWLDTASTDYAVERRDVLVRSSADGGLTWSPAAPAFGGPSGAATRRLEPEGLAFSGSDRIVTAFTDGRSDADRSRNVYVARSAASPLSFAEVRLDDDAQGTNPRSLDPDLATDGGSAVYASFAAVTTGPYSDIHVAASLDGGRTFATPVRASRSTPGSRINKLPRVHARPGGCVDLIYQADVPGAGRQIFFNRSTDSGSTWRDADLFVGQAAAACAPGFLCAYRPLEEVKISASGSDLVLVAWSTQTGVFLARSTDGGLSFTTTQLDASVGGFDASYYGPALCHQGSQAILTFISEGATGSGSGVLARVSQDAGATWAPPVNITGAGGPSPWIESLACADGFSGEALVTWTNDGGRPYANRWSGSAWEGASAVSAPEGLFAYTAPAVFSSPGHAVISYSDGRGLYAARSTDGGRTFPTFLRIDALAPVPEAESLFHRLVGDRQGSVWSVWDDAGAGKQTTVVIAHSGDDGATFDPPRALSRDVPQGGRRNDEFFIGVPAATLPGAGIVAWVGQRRGLQYDLLVNAHDVNDEDRDGAVVAADCDDTDPGVRAVPGEVEGLAGARVSGGVEWTWLPAGPAAGPATVHDVAGGPLGALRGGGDPEATCLAAGVGASYVDQGAPPGPGEGRYLLVRGRNSCGSGAFGSDPVDLAPPCP